MFFYMINEIACEQEVFVSDACRLFPFWGRGGKESKKRDEVSSLGLFDMRGENTPSLCVVAQITSVLLIS